MSIYLPTLDELNLNQKLVISYVTKLDKIAVLGGPGTGKTVLAILATKELILRKKKCLFICYSKTLKSFVDSLIESDESLKDYIEVKTYHSFFMNYFTEVTKDPKYASHFPKIKKNNREINYTYEFFNKLGDFKFNVKELDEFYEKFDVYQKYGKYYDYIFIDEGQDFEDGLINIAFKFATHIFFTFDDSQKLKRTNYDIPSKNRTTVLKDLKLEADFFDLIENYRNTSMTEMISKEINTNFDINDVSLKKLTTKKYSSSLNNLIEIDDNEVRLASKFIVKSFLKNKDREVAVLFYDGNRQLAEKVFNDFKEKIKNEALINNVNFFFKFGSNKENNNLINDKVNQNGLYLLSTTTSKGLEFDEVYLITKNIDYDDFVSNNACYVAITRSLDNINFILYKNDNSKLNEKIKNIKFISSKNFIDIKNGGNK